MKHIILGNGPAGVVAAETLRRAAPGDEILLVGNEDAPPYSRMAIPYLLEGNIDESGTYLRKSADHFDQLAPHFRPHFRRVRQGHRSRPAKVLSHYSHRPFRASHFA